MDARCAIEERQKSYFQYSLLRDSKKLTDYRVAENAGIARSTFSDWKKGLSAPKAEKLLKIARVLEVPVEKLIREEGE